MTQAHRTSTVLLIVCQLGFGQAQTPVAVPEPPEQAQKLLKYAAQMDADAKKARIAGQQRALEDARTLPEKLRSGRLDAPAEQLINQRTASGNGIYVDKPKVYDDSLLEQMLASAQSRLASLQGFDQSGLTRAIGTVTGANQQIASFGISGGSQPAVVQTSYGNITSPVPVPSASAPGPTTTLPTTQGPSASDILDEQLQLTSEITNLRLLQEGSLSDQIMVGQKETFLKPRVTLGFPVVISPEARYKNAVAIVEVLVETDSTNDSSPDGEPPAITALLPREKTYNVAAISDKSVSIGAGIATATAGVAANFLWGHKQYFIVKDQDTLAMQFDPTDSEVALLASQQQQMIRRNRLRAFSWQFRPVLGRPYVQAGVRQVFVQLAFPGPGGPTVKSFGSVHIRTYWRHVDPKTGVLSWIVPGSLDDKIPASPILNYDLRQQWGAVTSFNPFTDLEDIGSGKMLVKLDGRLLPGSYLRVGSTVVEPGSGGVHSDFKTTRFVANIADLATLKTFVISRDGTEYQLQVEPRGGLNQFRVDQERVTVAPLDDSSTLLQVPITNFNISEDIPPVLLIGGKVFGYSDAPIDRNCNRAAGTCVLAVALPKDFLMANPVVSVKALMLDESGMQAQFAATRTFTLYAQNVVQEKLVLLGHDQTYATYALYGSSLSEVSLVWPGCPVNQLCLGPLSGGAAAENVRLLKLPIDLIKNNSSVIFQRSTGGGRPFMVSLPPLPADATGTAATAPAAPKFKERVVVGSDEGLITGDKLDSVVSANFGGKPLTISKKTASSLKISGLAAAGASAVAKTQSVTLVDQAGKQMQVPLEVVSSKVEVLTK